VPLREVCKTDNLVENNRPYLPRYPKRKGPEGHLRYSTPAAATPPFGPVRRRTTKFYPVLRRSVAIPVAIFI